ncbi:hypothetical protein HanRHA438_Chr16g0767661 [Helianthus annuus]|nr:hypothetical protein HanRHA438_Chr16g0767661 [Helianthus annuus]
MVPKEEIAFKGISLMKLLSRCKPMGSTTIVAAPLKLLTGITCNSCSVAFSTVGRLTEIETRDSVTYCGISSLIGD